MSPILLAVFRFFILFYQLAFLLVIHCSSFLLFKLFSVVFIVLSFIYFYLHFLMNKMLHIGKRLQIISGLFLWWLFGSIES